MATLTALPSTNSVRSKMERTITLPNCGRRYGGSSSVKLDGTPFSSVFDKKREVRKVRMTPNTITPVNSSVDRRPFHGAATTPAKNIVIILISVGKRPLQGTKVLVIIAIRRSRGLSIIRAPLTPTALQPNPIHIVSACFPQVQAF